MKNFLTLSSLFILSLLFVLPLQAHDTWVQTNTNIVRAGDVIHIDLMLGNHGNDHRDFKLAGKPDLATSTLELTAPDHKNYDLRPQLSDMGYAPNEGFWTAKFIPTQAGLYTVSHLTDAVMSYAPIRSLKSAKTFFVVSKNLNEIPMINPGFDQIFGHPLELVPESNPVTPMGPGTPFKVRLLFKKKPLANTVVSFIPRGTKLKEGFDDRYERKTDAEGRVTFAATEANYHLLVAHHEDKNAQGEGYKSTSYSATLALYVPQICPCCGG